MSKALRSYIGIWILLTATACGDTTRYSTLAEGHAGPDVGTHTDDHDARPDPVAPDAPSTPDGGADGGADGGTDTAADTGGPPPTGVPCAALSTGSVNFGNVYVGAVHHRALTIENCSANAPLTVRVVRISADSASGFRLALLPPTSALAAGESLEVNVEFIARGVGRHRGTLLIETDDPEAPVQRVALEATVGSAPCADAIARVRAAGSEAPWDVRVQAPTASTVELDGSLSSSEASEISAYLWTVVQRPQGSTAPLSPSPAVPAPTLYLDTPGQYIVELEVTDQRGQTSCAPARVTITTSQGMGIEVQINWSSDASDVDLHFLHPRGHWNRAPYDVYWLNPQPNWADVASLDDDPSLDIDDTNGFGPERISLDHPEDVAYEVGAHLFSDHGSSEPTQVTVRVWLQGVLTYEASREVTQSEFWRAARIEWGARPAVTPIDAVTDSFPDN